MSPACHMNSSQGNIPPFTIVFEDNLHKRLYSQPLVLYASGNKIQIFRTQTKALCQRHSVTDVFLGLGRVGRGVGWEGINGNGKLQDK